MRCFKLVKKRNYYLFLFILFIEFVSAEAFLDINSQDFLNGTFANTTYSNTSVSLNRSLTGTFTSRIHSLNNFFEANNINVNFQNSITDEILLLDISQDVWKSGDHGISYSMIHDDYNDDTSIPLFFTIHNNGFLYIVESDDDIWVSNNNGLDWAKINDNYDNNPSSNGNPLYIASDLNNSLYIIEKDEDIWRSDNNALNFSKVNWTDFNKNNGDVSGITTLNNRIYLADKNSDIWTTYNKGISWILVKKDYNGNEKNAIVSMTKDFNNSLYIVENDDDVFKSINYGVTWSKINDDFNGKSTALELLYKTNAILISFDNNNIYIIEKDEDIWRSNNSGINFIKINGTDFNKNNGDVVGLVPFLGSTNFKYQIAYAQNLNNWSQFIGPNNNPSLYFYNTSEYLNIHNIKYIRYKTFFESTSTDLSSHLFDVNISITPDYNLPIIYVYSPTNTTYNHTLISINFSASDYFQIDSLWFSDEQFNRSYSNPQLLNITEGDHRFIFYANDTSNNINQSIVYFSIEIPSIPYPSVVINSPTNSTYNYTQILLNISNLSSFDSIWWFNGSTNLTYSDPIIYNFTVNTNSIIAFVNNSFGLTNKTEVSFSINLTTYDLDAPNIILLSPITNYVDTDGFIIFNFNASDSSPISNCSLLINNIISETLNNIQSNQISTFSHNFSAGSHNWKIQCTDIYNNNRISNSNSIIIILANNFNGNTTNLSLVNISHITNFTIENTNYGKIVYQEFVNLENGANLNDNINISNLTIEVNSDILSMLNKSAIISLYNVNGSNITILMDNNICPINICTFIDYLNNIYRFSVDHFTSFSLNASFVVSNTQQNQTNQSSGSGSSGSGGSSGRGGRSNSNSADAITPNSTPSKSPPSSPEPNTPLNNEETPETSGESENQTNFEYANIIPTRFRFPLWAVISIIIFLMALTAYEVFIIKKRKLKKLKKQAHHQ
ncbi:hypothetical protein J4471_05535 [Candidatus Woesearchaeota archaeon]|nr:hypothetical protein [Candidatus Woesearchaeota archaeon]